MEFRAVVRRRRMVRRFDPDRPVPEDVLRRCLEAALRAPSAGFSQGWNFVVLRSPAERGQFWTASGRSGRSGSSGRSGKSGSSSSPDSQEARPDAPPDAWLRGIRAAPVLVLCCADKDAYLDRYAEPDKGWTDRDEARWPIPYWDVDTGMASLLILLTAVDEGLGGLFFGVPAEAHVAVRSALDIPAGHHLVGVVALGYALPGPRSPSLRRPRRGVDEAVHWGRF